MCITSVGRGAFSRVGGGEGLKRKIGGVGGIRVEAGGKQQG